MNTFTFKGATIKSRGFFIRNFRNIGVCKDESQGVFLRLSGLEKENMGGLVIILGENNTGKSNLLEALAKFKKYRENPLSEKDSHTKFKKDCENPLSEKDSPSFLEYANCLPEIELSYRIPACCIYYPRNIYDDTKSQILDFQEYIDELQKSISCDHVYFDYEELNPDDVYFIIQNTSLSTRYLHCKTHNLECVSDNILPSPTISSKQLQCCLIINIDEQKHNKIQSYPNDSRQDLKLSFVRDYGLTILLDAENKTLKQRYSVKNACIKKGKKYEETPLSSYQLQKISDFNLDIQIPKIKFYKEETINNIDNGDLITTPETIAKSDFFEALFKNLGDNQQAAKILENIQDGYDKYKTYNNASYYEKIEGDINNQLYSVAQRFNTLYENKENKGNREIYRFRIRFCDNKISLNIYKNGQPLNLNEQSVGFRKFFNFFFNFIHKERIDKGDIVLIDEVETHLSVPAQREFRNFLKEFGQKTGILFVVSTHSPFMLDMQHLDEVRILKTKDDGMGIKIINDFYFIASKNQANTLLEMKEALGVDYCHLLNPKSKPIFVEGITDYNYLTAFALLYTHEKEKDLQLVFLPINGLGENSKDHKNHKEVMQAVIDFGEKLGKSPAILLVDEDDAGKNMEKLAKDENGLRVIKLSDVSKLSGENEIEDIFIEKDKNIFGISKNNKGSLQSSYFKGKIKLFIDEQSKKESERKNKIELNISKETKERFYALLEYLYIRQTCFLDKLGYFYEQIIGNSNAMTESKVIDLNKSLNEALELLGIECKIDSKDGKSAEQGITFVRKDTLGKEYVNGETPTSTKGIYIWFYHLQETKNLCLEFGFSLEKGREDCTAFDKMKDHGCFGDGEGRFTKFYPDFENHKDAILNDFLDFVSYYKSFDARDFRIQPTTGA